MNTGQKSGIAYKDDADRREFDRYAIDFEVEVRGLTHAGVPFCEQTKLRDISGGGLSLVTTCHEHYRHDQTLELKIKLPDTDKTESFMLCDAVVVWAGKSAASNSEHDPTWIGIVLSEKRTIETHERAPTGPGQGPRRSP